jgi:hypothetical protein
MKKYEKFLLDENEKESTRLRLVKLTEDSLTSNQIKEILKSEVSESPLYDESKLTPENWKHRIACEIVGATFNTLMKFMIERNILMITGEDFHFETFEGNEFDYSGRRTTSKSLSRDKIALGNATTSEIVDAVVDIFNEIGTWEEIPKQEVA